MRKTLFYGIQNVKSRKMENKEKILTEIAVKFNCTVDKIQYSSLRALISCQWCKQVSEINTVEYVAPLNYNKDMIMCC